MGKCLNLTLWAGLFAVVLLENDDEIDRLTGVETDETLDRRLLRGFPGVSWEGWWLRFNETSLSSITQQRPLKTGEVSLLEK